MQLKVHQAEKHRCKDILRSEKTGILIGWLLYDKHINSSFSSLFFLVPHIPVRWRFKSKRKVGAPSSSSLDIYLNHQIGNQIPNEHLSKSGACSPPPIKPPNTPKRCSSVETNIVKNANLSAGPSEKGILHLLGFPFLVALVIKMIICSLPSIYEA